MLRAVIADGMADARAIQVRAFSDALVSMRLLAASVVSDGFRALWERGRLDLTVEALVLRPEFRELFDDQELETARTRLEELGYGRAE